MDFILGFDTSLFHLINREITHPFLDIFFAFITDLHKTIWFGPLFLILGIGFYFYKFRKKGLYYFLMSLVSVGLSDWSASTFIKKNVERPRPFQTQNLEVIKRTKAHGSSFTSNHATNMFGMAFFHSHFFAKATGALYTVATLVAYSRVYNGVHFPLDVICGALWGVLIAYLMMKLTRRLETLLFKNIKQEPLT